MRTTIFILLLSVGFIFCACQKENTEPTFILGDTTTKTYIQTTEGVWQSVKLNGYFENVPHGVSLPWNEVRGLQGNWYFSVLLTIDNTDPDMVIQVLSESTPIYTATIMEMGQTKRLAFLQLKNHQGEPITIQSLSKNAHIAAQLIFNQ